MAHTEAGRHCTVQSIVPPGRDAQVLCSRTISTTSSLVVLVLQTINEGKVPVIHVALSGSRVQTSDLSFNMSATFFEGHRTVVGSHLL